MLATEKDGESRWRSQMSDAITTVAVEITAAQQRAVRQLALRGSKVSASELATNLFAQVVRGRFKAMVEGEVERLGALYDMASANGFEQALSKAEFISGKRAEYADILAEL